MDIGAVPPFTVLWTDTEDGWCRDCLRLAPTGTLAFIQNRRPHSVVTELGIELEEPSGRQLQKALIRWNDEEANDATQVIDVLRWSAQRAREAGDPECGPQICDE